MQPSVSRWMLSATAVALIGIGAYFIIARPPFLPEDLRYIGATEEAMRASAPKLSNWLSLVFRVMGGFIIATGTILLSVVTLDDLSRQPLRLLAVAVAALASLGIMVRVNFEIGSDYRWFLLAVLGLWCVGIVTAIAGVGLHRGSRR